MSDEDLISCLPLFLLEVVKKDGTPFPPNTLRGLILSLQMFLECQGRSVKLLSGPKFVPVQSTLDAVIKRSASQGLSLQSKQARVISEEMENVLWSRGLLGDKSPTTLLNTMVFVLGMHFALRGREEHRCLRHRPSQITVHTAADGQRYLEYREVVLH